MDTFDQIVDAIARTPSWVPLILVPSLLAAYTAAVLVFGGRKTYPFVATALGAAAAALVASMGKLAYTIVYFFLYTALAVSLRLFFFLPARKKRARQSRDERMYQKFRETLSEAPMSEKPTKVCCYDEEAVPVEDGGLRLRHAEELLMKLKKAPLSAADRLESEALARSLDGYRERPLTEVELRRLNDCLASVLRLTAKYKL